MPRKLDFYCSMCGCNDFDAGPASGKYFCRACQDWRHRTIGFYHRKIEDNDEDEEEELQ